MTRLNGKHLPNVNLLPPQSFSRPHSCLWIPRFQVHGAFSKPNFGQPLHHVTHLILPTLHCEWRAGQPYGVNSNRTRFLWTRTPCQCVTHYSITPQIAVGLCGVFSLMSAEFQWMFSDTVNFLGISIVGQTNKGGDGGIYVGSIMKGYVSSI